MAEFVLLTVVVVGGTMYGIQRYTAAVANQVGYCCTDDALNNRGGDCPRATFGQCTGPLAGTWALTKESCDYDVCNRAGSCCTPGPGVAAADACPAALKTKSVCEDGGGVFFGGDRTACTQAAAAPGAAQCVTNIGYCCDPININNTGQNCIADPLVKFEDCDGDGAVFTYSLDTCEAINNPNLPNDGFCKDPEGICCYPSGTTNDGGIFSDAIPDGEALENPICWNNEAAANVGADNELTKWSDCRRLGGTWVGTDSDENWNKCQRMLDADNDCQTPKSYCVYYKDEAGKTVTGCKDGPFDPGTGVVVNPPFNAPGGAQLLGTRLTGTAADGYATMERCTEACRIPVRAPSVCCDPTKPRNNRCAESPAFVNNPCAQCATKDNEDACNAVAGGNCAWRGTFCEPHPDKCKKYCCDGSARSCSLVPDGTANCADLGDPYVGAVKAAAGDCNAACGGLQATACPQGQTLVASMQLCNAQCGVNAQGGQPPAGGQIAGRQGGQGQIAGRQGGQGQITGQRGGQGQITTGRPGGNGLLSGNTRGNVGTLAGINGATSSVRSTGTTTSRTTSRTSSTTSRTSSTTSRTTSRTSSTTSRTSSTTSRTTSQTSSTTSRTSSTTSRTTSRTSSTTSRTSSTTSRTTSRTSSTTSRTSSTTSRTSEGSTTSRTTSRTSSTTSRTTSRTSDTTSRTTSRTSSTTSRTTSRTSNTTSRTTSRTSIIVVGSTTSRTSSTTSRTTSRTSDTTSRTTSRTSDTTSRTTSRTSDTTSRTTSRTSDTTSRTTSRPTSSTTSLRVSSTSVPRCGNDIREAGEQCGEPGLSCLSGQYCEPTTCRCNYSSSFSRTTSSRTSLRTSASTSSTSTRPYCGDGRADPGEQCGEPGLACRAGSTCDNRVCLCDPDLPKPYCGDGRINPGEQCGEPGLVCPEAQDCNTRFCTCSGGPLCGDGKVNNGEQCGEPGLVCGVGTYCEKRSCLCMPFITTGRCGDGIVDLTEECDDGNARNFDGCSAFCEYEQGYCGDGILQQSLGEQCEPSLHDPKLPFRCADDCRIQGDFCGNGIVDAGEQCDDGPNNSNIQNVRCRLDCSLSRCGDGILDSASEECDDGNRLWGDGCDRYCKREVDIVGSDQTWTTDIGLPASIIELPFLGVHGESRLTVVPGLIDLVAPRGPQPQPTSTPQTGPGVVAVLAAGAAAGVAWMRRRKK